MRPAARRPSIRKEREGCGLEVIGRIGLSVSKGKGASDKQGAR